MEIRVNNQLLDITLENENTLADIMQEITAWLGPKGYQIVKIENNGTELSINDPDKMQEITIDTIKELDITALTPLEQRIQYLNTLYQYFTLLAGALKAGNNKLIKDLKNEFPYIEKSIDPLLGSRTKSHTLKLKEYITSIPDEPNINAPDPEIISCLEHLILLIRSYIQEAGMPMEQLKNCIEKIAIINKKISDVSILLQTGKDKQAMDSVMLFIELSEKITRLVDNIHAEGLNMSTLKLEEESFADFMSSFNKALNEIVTGFNNNDSILIGDILEYEITPLLERLTGFITIIDREYQKLKKSREQEK